MSLGFVGIITACFSLGMSLSSPLFGFWSQKSRSTKGPTACGLILTAVGNLLYALLPTIKYEVKWFMLVARIFVGFGTGNKVELKWASALKQRLLKLKKVLS